MVNTADETAVHKSVRVHAPIERAFRVFVEEMETWWPATHHIGKTAFETIFVEPRVGGRWFERGVDGNLCDWGTVLAWNPPHSVTFSWHVGPGKPGRCFTKQTGDVVYTMAENSWLS